MSLEQALQDTDRVEYFEGSCEAIRAAVVEDGVDVRAYFPWSLLDNMEWYVFRGFRSKYVSHIDSQG